MTWPVVRKDEKAGHDAAACRLDQNARGRNGNENKPERKSGGSATITSKRWKQTNGSIG